MSELASLPRHLLHRVQRSRQARSRPKWPYEVVDVRPPPLSAGHTDGPPDFVGVGAQKAGTSWWYELVADHRGVHRSPLKELHFFENFWYRPFTDDNIAEYHRWFARPAGLLAGEWTPRYMHDWWTPPLLARAAPATKVLVMLRDPMERYRSGLAFDSRRGAGRTAVVADDAFARGLYGAQLLRLRQEFPAERTLVLQYERCVSDPATELERTYGFLGLDPAHRPARLTDHVGPRVEKPALPPGVGDVLRAALRDDLAALFELCPEIDPDLWPAAREGR